MAVRYTQPGTHSLYAKMGAARGKADPAHQLREAAPFHRTDHGGRVTAGRSRLAATFSARDGCSGRCD